MVVSGRTALRDAVAAMAASPSKHLWVADARGALVRTLTVRDVAAVFVRCGLLSMYMCVCSAMF